MARIARTAIAATLAIAGGWLAVELARRDAQLGPPVGADRLIKAIDAEPGVTAADEGRARAALRERPTDGRAYRVLGQAASARGATAEATHFHEIALRLAPRDRLARAALADDAFARGDVVTALEHLDALLRVAPGVREALLAQLAGQLARDDVRTALVARLKDAPNWRGALVPALLTDTTPAAGAEALLTQLSQQSALTPSELEARVTLLQRLGRADEARRVWVSSLPAAQQALAGPGLFDGGFEAPDVTGGFAWRVTPQTGVSVLPDDGAPAEGQSSLTLVFEGRAITGLGLEQPLALMPGRYRLTGQANNDTNARRPFAFQFVCAPSGPILAAIELPPAGGSSGWSAFNGVVDVPTSGCNSQRLRLNHLGRALSERIVTGTLRLDSLELRRE